jgi:hypothetical protein
MTDHPADLHLVNIVHGDDRLQLRADAGDAVMTVTDRRLVIADEHRVIMNIPFSDLRRIQFDIERSRPATFVVVPDSAWTPPYVIGVEPDHYEEFGSAIAYIGRRLAGTHD